MHQLSKHMIEETLNLNSIL